VLSILIPAYNEAANVTQTVERIQTTMEPTGTEYEIIVIDDGSEDDTAARAEALGVRVLRHPTNGGYGRALKTGMRHARYDWCAIVDADGSYPVDRLPELLSYVPRFDMVVGARTGAHYWGSPRKRLARLVLRRVVNFVVGMDVPDVNSGMRVFRKAIALAHARRISGGFSFTTTLTLAMLLDEHFVHYVPIDYYQRVGRSKVRPGVDSLRMLQIVTQAIVYYNPLKIFLPICFASVAVGVMLGVPLAVVDGTAALLFIGVSLLVALLVGAVGLLADAVRLHRSPASDPESMNGRS
jgi:glycosyltransferase involved in cell wall biosynthesis